jgi:HD-GYP domain-containing protein (c-di-GMP phosphodiesterase class II)
MAPQNQDPALDSGEPPDHYASHLAKVNESNTVTASQDVYNERGVLILRKGAALTHQAAAQLLKHRLARPLDQQVQLQTTLNRHSIKQDFSKLLERFPDLQQTHSALRFPQEFDLIVDRWDFPPLLAQKLTVMREQMPVEYQKGLFVAWLSSLVARELALGQGAMSAVYVAGLVHDIGLMHIDPSIVGKSTAVTAVEWRAIQSHVVIGKVILDGIGASDPRIARAVLEHHERCDGIGYPLGKTANELDVLGQIIATADAMQAIRVNQFAKVGRNLRDLHAHLQMNANVHTRPVYEAMSALLRRSGVAPTTVNPLGQLGVLVTHLRRHWVALSKVSAYVETLLQLVQKIQFGDKNKGLRLVFERLLDVITQSGLMQPELEAWLSHAERQPDPATLPELTTMDLMLHELRWQLQDSHRAIRQLLEPPPSDPTPEFLALRQMAEEMSVALEGLAPPSEGAR